ncbi:MAG: LuxR C-terminal-related transcriptional regulator [Syntrophomonadaceae bacterium]
MSSNWSERWVRRFGTTNEALFVADDKGRIKYWSEGAERLVGYSEEEVLGKRCYSVLCGRRGGKPWCQPDCAIRRTVRRGALPAHVVLDVRPRDGRRIPVSAAFLVRKDRKKYVVAHLLQDASDQQRLRQALDEMMRLLHGVEADASVEARPEEPAVPPFQSCSEAADISVLTRRETEALRCLTAGMANEDIAKQLGVSPLTARNHVQHTLKKLGLHRRTQAVAAAIDQGLR